MESVGVAKGRAARFKVGDVVRVVRPEFFIRCGYPLDFDAVLQEVLTTNGPAISTFLETVGVLRRDDPGTLTKIARAVAYAKLRERGFGGRERKIYTQVLPALTDYERAVVRVRYVKTGRYEPSRYHTSLDSMTGEVEPPCLAGGRTHRILELALHWPDTWKPLEIEDVHVEKVVYQ